MQVALVLFRSVLPQDFVDLFECLNEAEVEYMLIGGYAVIFHGYLRTTQDLDVWVRASPENAIRVMKAMEELQMMDLSGVGGVDVDGGWWIIILYWYRGLSGQYNY